MATKLTYAIGFVARIGMKMCGYSDVIFFFMAEKAYHIASSATLRSDSCNKASDAYQWLVGRNDKKAVKWSYEGC
jgi:hypothetical protein